MNAYWRWVVVGGVVAVAAGCGKSTGPAPPSRETATEESSAEAGEIVWGNDFQAGMKKAAQEGKPIMVDVFATWCPPCKQLDAEVFSRADVAKASESFVTVRIDGDEHPDLREKLKVSAYPTVLFLMPDGTEIGRSLGAVSYQVMLDEMAKAKTEFTGRSG